MNQNNGAVPEKKQSDFPLSTVLTVVGVVVVVCVTFLLTREPAQKNVETAKKTVTRQPSSESRARIAVEADMAKKLPAAKDTMLVPKLSEITGGWVMRYDSSGIAELKVGENSFELVTTEDSEGRLRRYSRGDIRYDEKTGKLSLVPSPAAGAPLEIESVIYRILTMRAHDVFVRKYSNSSVLYLLASTDQFMAKDLHPLFSKVDFGGAPLLKFFPIEEQVGRP